MVVEDARRIWIFLASTKDTTRRKTETQANERSGILNKREIVRNWVRKDEKFERN
jgi:hypothetical protein